MKMLRADTYRLFHSKRLLFVLMLYVAAIFLCNYSDLYQFNEFLSVDTLIDSITESGWFREILYLISALPFTLCYCEDSTHNYMYHSFSRGTITTYAHSKVIITVVGTFFLSLIGFSISISLLALWFPIYDPNAFTQLNISGGYGQLTLSPYPYTFFIARVLLFSSGCALWSIITLFISSFKTDYFLTTIMPFISSYIIYRLSMNLPDLFNVDFCISGYGVIKNASLLNNFLYAMGYIWLLITLVSIFFIRRLERSMQWLY